MTRYELEHDGRTPAEDGERAARIENERKERRRRARMLRDQVCRDLGMVKVRGNLGGTYWE